ncbi:MAG: catalase family peroxidase [Thermoleophilaceae bacterium]
MAESLAEQAVNAINDISGVHPGHRSAHAKGVLLTATFTPTAEAAGLTTAAHMQGEPVRATVRFSNGGGNPEIPDYAREGRGMAVKFYLPDGSTTDIVALSIPCFFARTPEDFLEFTRLRKPDPETGQPNMEKLGAWLGEHPEAQQSVQAAVGASPPESYATAAYNSIHSFSWVDSEGNGRWLRYRFVPEEGERSISDEEARERGRHYLAEDIVERSGAAFKLLVVLAEDGDPIDDPTAAWPEERQKVEVGRLELGGEDTEREQGDDVLVLDPTRVTDGIELSDDPILRFRPRAYAVSVERRSGAPIPAALA